jgi:hypothetical protein
LFNIWTLKNSREEVIMFKKSGLLAVLALTLGLSTSSWATTKTDVKVIGVGVHWENTGYAYLADIPECGIFYNSITDERWKYFHSMLVAAKLSGKNIQRVDYTVTNAESKHCTIDLIEL